MGRYYNGDINGKFWFGLQSSNAADRFGSTGSPSDINYYFDEDDIESVSNELNRILDNLGTQFSVIENFFAENNGYNDEMIKGKFTIKELSEYADYKLGEKIHNHLLENHSCQFSAEI